MIDNLHKNTDKTLEQWIAIVHKESFAKHGKTIQLLKSQHGQPRRDTFDSYAMNVQIAKR